MWGKEGPREVHQNERKVRGEGGAGTRERTIGSTERGDRKEWETTDEKDTGET